MRELLLFHLQNCPYCIKARHYMAELNAENPRYAAIPVKLVEENENPNLAYSYDYFYVPCFFIDGKKAAEGVIDKAGVQAVYDKFLAGE